MKTSTLTTMCCFGLLALSACTSNTVKETLGLERSPPDEFRVVSRPPLSVPPQFSLRPPSNSDLPAGQVAADKKAQSILTGNTGGSLSADTAITPVTVSDSGKAKKHGKSSGNSSTADAQFLRNAGADQADPKVRDSLVEERYAVEEKKEEKPWWDIFSTDDDKKDPMVDAKKEAQRIQKNEDEGQPVTKGDTPEVKPKDTGLLNSVLGN